MDQRRALSQVLAELGVPGSAAAEGRVFVNQMRSRQAEQQLRAGDVVEVYRLRTAAQRGTADERTRVLERRGDLVVVDKPASLASEPAHDARGGSLVEQLREELGPGVHLLSRLDVGVSGLLLVSTSPAATRHARALRAAGELGREYLAIAGAVPEPQRGAWRSPVGQGKRQRPALTEYRVLATTENLEQPAKLGLLLLQARTGRTHQLRVHSARATVPLLGDRRYGGAVRLLLAGGRVLGLSRVMLHAARLTLRDLDGAPWCITRSADELQQIWELSGGEASAFHDNW